MNQLTRIANNYQLDKGTIPPQDTSWFIKYPDHETLGYTEIYTQYMENKRDKIRKIMEIGIYDLRFPGGSLKMWYDYLPYAEIWGIDNFWGNTPSDEVLNNLQNHRTHIGVADQSDRKAMAKVFSQSGSDFDFIIEDGAHWPSHIMICLVCCLPHVKSGGFYFIEDLQTSINAGIGAYDNVQITQLWYEYISTGNLSRLYITRQEHENLLNSIKSVKMYKCKNSRLLAIEKK
jgi:hypothetical protein